jgi:hypothetical protein
MKKDYLNNLKKVYYNSELESVYFSRFALLIVGLFILIISIITYFFTEDMKLILGYIIFLLVYLVIMDILQIYNAFTKGKLIVYGRFFARKEDITKDMVSFYSGLIFNIAILLIVSGIIFFSIKFLLIGY